MAQPKPKPSKRGLGARLGAKVGPLPVWAWAAVILGAYLLWSHSRRGQAVASPADSTAAPSSGDDSSAQVPASGQGSSVDNLNGVLLDSLSANTSSLDALTSQLLSMPTPYADFGDAPAAGTRTSAPAPSAAVATVQPASPAAAGAPPAHQTQTATGVLHWGGLTFTTRAAFDKWAKSHGTTSTKELANHPQAKAIYSSLG